MDSHTRPIYLYDVLVGRSTLLFVRKMANGRLLFLALHGHLTFQPKFCGVGGVSIYLHVHGCNVRLSRRAEKLCINKEGREQSIETYLCNFFCGKVL